MGLVKMRCRPLPRLLRDRRGTAEIVGSVLFLVILLFFFTNVYLWHDQATRRMDNVVVDRLNSPVEVGFDTVARVLNVTNKGGVGVALSRLWIADSTGHNYGDFENYTIWVAGGNTMYIYLDGSSPPDPPADVSYQVASGKVYYVLPTTPGEVVVFKILTTLGNTATYRYVVPYP